MMKLYWAPRTRSLRALWVLEEAGVPYERVRLDLSAGPIDQLTADGELPGPLGVEGDAIGHGRVPDRIRRRVEV